ncbi:MAG: sigma-70 family RNA polymerase sigma factor [Candidatus Cohnella colombiensis]|uniref:RNA polymerase sigma factor n=1 Tax=Candidatus Cohnella colombiensis TaxID=3121368 RepID=A0AA95EVV1_9BACL|nr:MAG: sigma-70 family RNA polymerase sigma factor [Cohnella sp.]
MLTNELEQLEHSTRELQRKFNDVIAPYRETLWRYCMLLTKSPWDAEDLLQETLLKAYASLAQLFQPLYPKPYLFRIASNTWIDQCRKRSPVQIPLEEEMMKLGSLRTEEVIESMEFLLNTLPPRQVVIVLLIDVFDFTIKEAASLLSTTDATIKSALQRARQCLRSANARSVQQDENPHEQTKIHHAVLNSFVEYYNRRDVEALCSLIDENITEEDGSVFRVYGRDQMVKSCLADWQNEPRVLVSRRQTLWGKDVVVVLHQCEGDEYLHSIMYLSVEDEKIVKWQDYYFSRELLEQASGELQVQLDREKNLFGNS